MVKADDNVSDEEQFILDEINSILLNHGKDEAELNTYEVAIAPQNKDQRELISTLLPEIVVTHSIGGNGYFVGAYHSERFAQMVCKKYRSLNLFTAIEAIPAVTATGQENAAQN